VREIAFFLFPISSSPFFVQVESGRRIGIRTGYVIFMQRENFVGERKRARVGFVLLVVLSEGLKYKETDEGPLLLLARDFTPLNFFFFFFLLL
jgi:hypothetical protein